MMAADPDMLAWTLGGASEAGPAAQLAARAFDPHFREAWTEAQMASLLAAPGAWLALCRARSGLVAFALSRQASDEVELLLCATDPACRRRGLGRELVADVVRTSRLRGARRLFLEVRASNEAALALYRAAGFVPTGRRPSYYRTVTGVMIDAISLSHDLRSHS